MNCISCRKELEPQSNAEKGSGIFDKATKRLRQTTVANLDSSSHDPGGRPGQSGGTTARPTGPWS